MAIINSLNRRRVIPNWRDFKSTLENGELKCQLDKSFKIPNSDRLLQERIDDFLNSSSIGTAADLVSVAYVLEKYENPDVKKALDYIEENKKSASQSLKDLGEKFRSQKFVDQDKQIIQDKPISPEENYILNIRTKIGQIKKYLRLYPINPIAWVEISRLYSMLGQKTQSEKAMKIALTLDPNNRFIIRSAVRLFIHNDKADEAYYYIRKTESLKFDPWLLSTEIATSCILERRPKFVKESVSLIDSGNFSNFSITELSSSLGTLEFYEGSSKKSKGFFRKSLLAPNDNSLAQVEWISKEDRSLQFNTDKITIKNPQEAYAIKSFEDCNWNRALHYSESWLNDIPFSTRPVLIGSFVAETFLDDNEKAMQLCKRGLIANPNDIIVQNNLICSYAQANMLDDAVQLLERIKPEIPDLSDENKIVLQATTGLILFRLGEYEKGRELYMKAIENAKNGKFEYLKNMAHLHLTREEINAKTDQIESAITKTEKEILNSTDSDVKELFKIIKKKYESEKNK